MSLITVNVHSNDVKLDEILSVINNIGEKMATQEEIDALTAQVNKVMAEVTTAKQVLVDQIAALEAQIAAGQTVDLTALKAAVQSIDDINPDA